jgi:hypothetical protein
MKRMLALLSAVFLAGCAGSAPQPPSYDVSAGRFLTAEEYANLSRDEALQYCDQLVAEVDIQKDNAEAAAAEAASLQPQVDDLEARLAGAKGAADALAAEVDALERGRRATPERPGTYTVRQDDWLYKIARSAGVYGDEKGWEKIFEANRDKISDPNLIYPGQELEIPR